MYGEWSFPFLQIEDREEKASRRLQIPRADGDVIEFHVPGPPLGFDLAPQLGLKFDLALVTQFQGDQLTCPMADAVGDMVPCDIEDPAVIEDTAHDDVGMSMAGVVMVDCDPNNHGM